MCVATHVCTYELYPFDPNSQPFSSPCRLSVLHLCYGPPVSRSGEEAHIGARSILRALWEWNSRIPVLGAGFRFRGVTGRINSSQYWHVKICRVLPNRKAPPSLVSRVFIGVQSHLWFTSHMLELSLRFFQRLSSYLSTPSLWSYSRYHVAKISLHKHIVRLSSVVQHSQIDSDIFLKVTSQDTGPKPNISLGKINSLLHSLTLLAPGEQGYQKRHRTPS